MIDERRWLRPNRTGLLALARRARDVVGEAAADGGGVAHVEEEEPLAVRGGRVEDAHEAAHPARAAPLDSVLDALLLRARALATLAQREEEARPPVEQPAGGVARAHGAKARAGPRQLTS